MDSGMFISCILSVISAVVTALMFTGAWKYMKQKAFPSKSSSSTGLLGMGFPMGGFAKPKILNKPMQGIQNQVNNNNQTINNNTQEGNSTYNTSQIPNMRGVDSGNDMPQGAGDMLPGMSAGAAGMAGIGGGAGFNVAVGAVSGIIVGGQSGNISNALKGKISHPVTFMQTGTKFTNIGRRLGKATFNEQASGIGNKVGKGAIYGSGNFTTSIAGKGTKLTATGNSTNYLSGQGKPIIKAPSGVVKTNGIKSLKGVKAVQAHTITGVGKAQSLNAQRFVSQNGKVSLKNIHNINEFKVKNQRYKLTSGVKARELAERKEETRQLQLNNYNKQEQLNASNISNTFNNNNHKFNNESNTYNNSTMIDGNISNGAALNKESVMENRINTVAQPIIMIVNPSNLANMTMDTINNITNQLNEGKSIENISASSNVKILENSRVVDASQFGIGDGNITSMIKDGDSSEVKKILNSETNTPNIIPIATQYSHGIKPLVENVSLNLAPEVRDVVNSSLTDKELENIAKRANARADFATKTKLKQAFNNVVNETKGAKNRLSKLSADQGLYDSSANGKEELRKQAEENLMANNGGQLPSANEIDAEFDRLDQENQMKAEEYIANEIIENPENDDGRFVLGKKGQEKFIEEKNKILNDKKALASEYISETMLEKVIENSGSSKIDDSTLKSVFDDDNFKDSIKKTIEGINEENDRKKRRSEGYNRFQNRQNDIRNANAANNGEGNIEEGGLDTNSAIISNANNNIKGNDGDTSVDELKQNVEKGGANFDN